MLRSSIVPTFLLILFSLSCSAPVLNAQVEVDRDFEVRPDETLRGLAGRIRERYGDANLKRFEFGLGEGLDIRNGATRARLVERHLVVRKPISQRGGTEERPQAFLDFPIQATIEVTGEGGPLRHVPFVLHDSYRVEKVRSVDRLLGFERLGTILSVTLPAPLAEGRTVRIEVEYMARLDVQRVTQGFLDRGFLVRVASDAPYVLARSSIAWYPSLRGQSVPGSLKIWVGRAWRALGPGELENDRPEAEEGFKTFRMSQPQDPYFVAGYLEKLRVHRAGRWFEWIGPRERLALGRILIDRCASALEWFETLRVERSAGEGAMNRAVPVPPADSVAVQIASLDSPWASTECWEILFTTTDVVPNQDTITALLGRTWWWAFGRVRTALDEALFVYLGRRHAIELGLRNEAGDWMTTGESGLYVRSALRHGADLPSLRSVLRGEAAEPWLSAITLAGKGALFFRALVREVGFETLIRAMNDVLVAASGTRIEVGVWREFLERASGRDLDLLFSGWMDAERLPQYAISDAGVERLDEGFEVRFTLRAGDHPVGLPVPLAIETEEGVRRDAIAVEDSTTKVQRHVSVAPKTVEVDPEFVLLRDPRSLGLPLHPSELASHLARLTALVVVHDGKGGEERVSFAREVAKQMGERMRSTVHLAKEARILTLEEAQKDGLPERACVVLLGERVVEEMGRALGLGLPRVREGGVLVGDRRVSAAEPGFVWYGQRPDDARFYLAWTPLNATLQGPRSEQWVIYDGVLPVLSGFDAPSNELRETLRVR